MSQGYGYVYPLRTARRDLSTGALGKLAQKVGALPA
jgi:hypothetical protein